MTSPADAAPARHPQGMRAMLWLKTREWLGPTRDQSRLLLIAILAACWVALIVYGAVQSANAGRITDPRRDLLFVSAGAWPLWAVIPLLGGGGGEVVAAHRLAAYPVSSPTVFGGAWLTGLVDLPYIIIGPLVLGLATAYAGIGGFVAGLALIAGASATGQLMAWGSYLALAGRRRTGLAAVVLTIGVVGLLGALPALLPHAADASTILPGGWLRSAGDAAIAGAWDRYWAWVVLLTAPVPIAIVVGPWLTGLARDREARAGGVGARPWGSISWFARGSRLRLLVIANLRSMARAVGAQVALAGVLAVPTITRLPGVDVAQVSLIAMGGVAGIAGATVLGVNAFAFDAGGAPVLLSWPVRPRELVLAKAAAVATLLLIGQLAVTLLGAVALGTEATELSRALVLCLGRTAGLAGLALIWSVRMPAPSDYDSLRARISTPAAIISYCLVAGVVAYAVSQGAQHLPGVSGAFAITALSIVAAFGALRIAERDLAEGGIERVASGVVG